MHGIRGGVEVIVVCCLTFAVGDLHSKKAPCVCTSGETLWLLFFLFQLPALSYMCECSILIIKSPGPTLSHLVVTMMQPTKEKSRCANNNKAARRGISFLIKNALIQRILILRLILNLA